MQHPEMEMSVFEAILARRSVRAYAPQTVDRTTVNLLLEAAVRAPTAMDEQPWAFVIVQDPAVLQRLSDTAKPLFVQQSTSSAHGRPNQRPDMVANPEFNIFYDAGTLIVICARSREPFVVADCWLAAENLMLAACAMKLGTCVIGMALPALNTPSIKAELDIPDMYCAIAPIVVGYPRGETAATSRREPFVLSHVVPMAVGGA